MLQPIGTKKLVSSHQGSTSFWATPIHIPHARVKSFQAQAGVSTSTGTANFQFYGSNEVAAPATTNAAAWVAIGSSVNLAPDASTSLYTSGGFSDTDAWNWITVNVTNLTGTNITVSAYVAG